MVLIFPPLIGTSYLEIPLSFFPSFYSSIIFSRFLLHSLPPVFSLSSCMFPDLQPLTNCSCTGAVSDPGTDFEGLEEDAAGEVGES